MRKFSNFCGIFATVFVTTTVVLLASCSQDDDNYDSDMYTMAEMGTRLGGGGGDPGGGGSGTGGEMGPVWLEEGSDSIVYDDINIQHDIVFNISWNGQFYDNAHATITWSAARNRSNELFYYSLGIRRSVRRYNFIKCEVNTKIVNICGDHFIAYDVQVFYRKAKEHPVDGTYENDTSTHIIVDYSIPQKYIVYEQ